MAILTIDGWEIPVESVTRGVEYLDTYKRAFSGNLRDGTRFAKRKWDVTTAYLNQDDAKTLRALILNEGDRLSPKHITGSTKWDNDSKNFLISDKGNVINTSNVATYRPYEGPNKTHAFALEPYTTNALKNDTAVDPSLEGSITGGPAVYACSGFTIPVTNVTPSKDTTYPYHGNSCLKFTGSGSTDFRIFWTNYNNIPITTLGFQVGDTITFSWYDRHNIDLSSVSGDTIPMMRFFDSSKTELPSTMVSLNNLGPANINWHQHSITVTIPTNTVYILIQIGFDNPDFTTGAYYCIDGIQLEKNTIPTSFTMTSKSNTTGKIPFSIGYNPNEISFFVRFNNLKGGPAFVFYQSSSVSLISFGTSGTISSKLTLNGNTSFSCLNIPYTLSTWNNYFLVFNYNTSSVKQYLNGEKRTEQTINKTLLNEIDNLIEFNPLTTNTLVNEIYMLPFAVSDSFAKAYTSSWYVPNNNLLVSGDCANGQIVPCYGEVGDTETASYWQGGIVYLAEKVRFTLYEI